MAVNFTDLMNTPFPTFSDIGAGIKRRVGDAGQGLAGMFYGHQAQTYGGQPEEAGSFSAQTQPPGFVGPMPEDAPQQSGGMFDGPRGDVRDRALEARAKADAGLREYQTHAGSNANTAALEEAFYADQKGQTEKGIAARRADLGGQGFQEYATQNPGSLFYKADGPPTASAFGMPVSHVPSQGTASMSPMGGRALQAADDTQATEDANRLFQRRLAEGRAEDPFGLRVLQAKTGFVQQRLQQVNDLYSQSLSKLNAQLQSGLIDKAGYESSKAAMDQERAIKNEQIEPTGGFDKAIRNSLY